MTKYLIPVALGPILMAWGVTAYLYGSLTPSGGSYAGGSDGFGEIFFSLSIMFCIAIWVGALFSYLLVRHNQNQEG